MGLGDGVLHVLPFKRHVEVDTDPASRTDVGWSEVVFGVAGNYCPLRPLGRSAPDRDAVVVMLSREGCEEAAPDEPRRLAVADFLRDVREGEADGAEAIERHGSQGTVPNPHNQSMERRYSLFNRIVDDLPVLIQCASIEPGERFSRPWAASVVLPYKQNDVGLPTDGELQRVGKIEEQLDQSLKATGAVHVGHLTGAGAMRVVFYSQSQGSPSVLVKTGLLKKENIALDWRHDPSWSLYEMQLQPTAFEAMLDRFRDLWFKLYQLGDNPELPRDVDFAAFFPSAERRTAFVAEAGSNGFSFRDQTPEHDGQFWCEATKFIPIAPEAIVPECIFIDETARRHGGEFDGWACHVTT